MWGQFCEWWGPGYFFGGPWNMIIGIVFWALVVYGVFYLFSRLQKGIPREGGTDVTPIEILKRRYARGEISDEEFAKARKNLET